MAERTPARADCTHRDVERGDEFNPDRCRACYAPVFPPSLTPQPPPANPPRGPAVWPMAIAMAEQHHVDERVIALMRARDEQGRAKYGVSLCANDGRDTSMDAIQEALDLIVYLEKKRMEGGLLGESWFVTLTGMVVVLLDGQENDRG